nr:helix-turn-helix domain-containing protein [Actinomadura bangladeshensis]
MKDASRDGGGRMLRIHFTSGDLARVRVAGLGPLAETQLSLQVLQRRDEAVAFGAWRRRAGPALPPEARALARFLAPAAHAPVDLFTLVGAVEERDEFVDRVMDVPLEPLRVEVETFPGLARRRPPWLRHLGHEEDASHRLATAARGCYDAGLRPYWTRINDHLEAEKRAYARAMADGGVHGLLSSLRPMLQWKPPILEVPGYRPYRMKDLHLNGRGVVLAPSLFCRRRPLVYGSIRDPGAAVLVICPVLRDPLAAAEIWAPPTSRPSEAVVALLGRTRAEVLDCVAEERTTSEIAERLRISVSGASQHAAVLRRAGLLTSRRDANRVLHHLSVLGAALLDGRSPAIEGT